VPRGGEKMAKKPEPGRRMQAAIRRGEKPTLKTISMLSGLAVPTVSRALNDAPDIGAETKKRVRRIADEIGYVPNRAGVRLRTGRTNVISLVLSTQHDMMNHTARLISSLAGHLRGTQFHLIVTPFFPDEDPMRPIRYIVETGSADAIVMNQIEPQDPRVAYLMERKFPFATHGRSDWRDQHAYFDYDNGVFGQLSVSELVKRQRKNILLVAPPKTQNYAMDMREGAMTMACRLSARLTVLSRVTSDSPSSDLMARVAEMLTGPDTPDGIICGSTSSAMALIAAFEAAGRVIGEDFDVVAKEAIPVLQMFRPPVIAMYEDVARAGEFLAEAAINAIRHPDLPPMQELDIPGQGLKLQSKETT